MIGELHSGMGIGLHAEFKPKGLFTLIGESASDLVGGSESNGCGLKTAELRERQKSSNTIKTHTIDKQIHMTDTRRTWAESKLPTPRERRVNKIQWIDTYSHVCKSNTSEPTYPLTNK